jgi:hypothetical protein
MTTCDRCGEPDPAAAPLTPMIVGAVLHARTIPPDPTTAPQVHIEHWCQVCVRDSYHPPIPPPPLAR